MRGNITRAHVNITRPTHPIHPSPPSNTSKLNLTKGTRMRPYWGRGSGRKEDDANQVSPHYSACWYGCRTRMFVSHPQPLTVVAHLTHPSGNSRGLMAQRNFTMTIGPPSNQNETVIKCQQYWNEPNGSAVCKACGFTYLWNGT